MDSELHIYEEIDDYLKGKMSTDDRAKFERSMAADPTLSQQVKSQQLANEIVLTKGLMDLKSRIASDLASGRSVNKSPWIWGWGGTLGILLMLASWFLIDHKPVSLARGKSPVVAEKVQEKAQGKGISMGMVSEKPIERKNSLGNNQTLIVPESVPTQTPAVMESGQNPISSHPTVEEAKLEQKMNIPASNEKQTVDCGAKHWNFTLHAHPACVSTNDGSIDVIDKVHYQYALGDGNFTPARTFNHLKKGIYSVSVKDEDGCITTSEVEVYQRNCQESLEVAFNPLQESWKVPIKDNNKGELQIFSKNGRLAFSKQWSQGEEFEWDGKTNSGDLLGRGLYSFTIQYANGEIQQGSISITY
ncbi:MAG: hypothetical protein K2Q22_15380 [Cytophagales bacterium]|nr:hypothetical protein [Cytophagales bacterium]